METAVRRYAADVRASVRRFTGRRRGSRPCARRSPARSRRRRPGTWSSTPYAFHVSEDIYTSVLLHARRGAALALDLPPARRHPHALAAGSPRLDDPALQVRERDARHRAAAANPLRLRGLSAWQKVMYGATMYAYLAPLWTLPLMLAPLVYFFAGVTPVRAYDVALVGAPPPVPRREPARAPRRHLGRVHLAERAVPPRLVLAEPARARPRRSPRRPLRFAVTPKERAAGRAPRLAAPHLALLAAMAVGRGGRGAAPRPRRAGRADRVRRERPLDPAQRRVPRALRASPRSGRAASRGARRELPATGCSRGAPTSRSSSGSPPPSSPSARCSRVAPGAPPAGALEGVSPPARRAAAARPRPARRPRARARRGGVELLRAEHRPRDRPHRLGEGPPHHHAVGPRLAAPRGALRRGPRPRPRADAAASGSPSRSAASSRLPLCEGGLPNKAYDTRTLAMVRYDGAAAPGGHRLVGARRRAAPPARSRSSRGATRS